MHSCDPSSCRQGNRGTACSQELLAAIQTADKGDWSTSAAPAPAPASSSPEIALAEQNCISDATDGARFAAGPSRPPPPAFPARQPRQVALVSQRRGDRGMGLGLETSRVPSAAEVAWGRGGKLGVCNLLSRGSAAPLSVPGRRGASLAEKFTPTVEHGRDVPGSQPAIGSLRKPASERAS